MAWPCITRACCINRFWSDLDKGDIAVPLVFTKYSDVAEVQHLHPQPKSLISQKPPVTTETQPAHCAHPPAKALHAAADAAGPASSSQDGSSASVMREDFKAWSVRPERSCKPRNEYQPSKTPFNNLTQYQKDYKPWPIPKKGDHPWIPKATPAASSKDESKFSKHEPVTSDVETGVEKCEIEEKQHEKESKEKRKTIDKKEKISEGMKTEQVLTDVAVDGKKRSTADALNRQIKQDVRSGSSYR